MQASVDGIEVVGTSKSSRQYGAYSVGIVLVSTMRLDVRWRCPVQARVKEHWGQKCHHYSPTLKPLKITVHYCVPPLDSLSLTVRYKASCCAVCMSLSRGSDAFSFTGQPNNRAKPILCRIMEAELKVQRD